LNIDALKAQLIIDEALRLRPYRCTQGKLTIGVGHNLDDKPISKRAAEVILEDDIADVVADLDRALPWWRQLDDARQNVLANMCFNLGLDRLLGFTNTLAAMKRGDYEWAAQGMEDSRWAKQVGARADRLIAVMRAKWTAVHFAHE